MSAEKAFHTASRELAADAIRVWDIISDFGGLTRWSAAVESCSADGNGAGALRTVKVAGAEIVERLEKIDPSTFFLRYRPISGSVMPIEGLNVSMKLIPLSESRTRIDWSVFGNPTIDQDKARATIAKRYEFRLDELEACLRESV